MGYDEQAERLVSRFGGLVDGFILDVRDTALQDHIAVPVHITDTLMLSAADRTRVAHETLAFRAHLRQKS